MQSLRITGGFARSIHLKCAKKHVRPATDFLRQALFSSLGGFVKGASFLDLFAGVGCYGLEAISRGATSGTFVEKNRVHLNILNENLAAVTKSLTQPVDVRIVCSDFFLFVEKNQPDYDLIFLDPPYEVSRERSAEILMLAGEHLKESPNSRLLFEMPADLVPHETDSLVLLKELGKKSKDQPKVAIYGVR